MKFCKDCKWLVEIMINQSGGSVPKCVYGLGLEYDIVDGHEYYTGEPVPPNFERNDMGSNRKVHCGRKAKYYERKWWKFWRPK